MAKGKTLIFSLGASGRLGPDLVLTKHGHTTVARRYKPPTDARSIEQLARRSWFAECVEAWHQLTPAQKEEYRLVDPRIGTNPAYLNFMREWLHMAVPVHAPTHEVGGADELELKDISSGQVGESAGPQLTFHQLAAPARMLDLANQGSVGLTNLDVSAWVPASAVAILCWVRHKDTGSAGAQTYLRVDDRLTTFLTRTNGSHINNMESYQIVVVPMTVSQWIRYLIQASGPNTSRNTIDLWGWWEPTEV